MFDTIILNGIIIDGTKKSRYHSDIGIYNGNIKAIGNLNNSEAKNFINAENLIVSPGFIDIHSHSDLSLLVDPGGESKVHQGVTTEVTGNCSLSPFPTGKASPEILQKSIVGQILDSDINWKWKTLDDWAQNLESNGLSINIAPQVGQAALQIATGATKNQPATKEQIEEMKFLLIETIEQGAFSLSTGLSLAPSIYSSTNEIIELCKSISQFPDIFYATHAREAPGNQFKMIEEAIQIGQQANIPVQFSHIAIIDHRFYGSGPKMIRLFEKAFSGGLDISYDIYPYTAAGAGLNQAVPTWAQSGTINEYLKRIKNSKNREKIKSEITNGIGGLKQKWSNWIISDIKNTNNKNILGLSIEEISHQRNISPAETILQIIEEERGAVPTTVHNRLESDVKYFLSHELAMIGSDGNAISPNGFYKNSIPHPRFYGTFPRILGRYTKGNKKILSLENAIYKMSGFPAKRLKMKKRGTIKINNIADLVIFNPETIIDQATFENPHQYSIGIHHVLVNGISVIKNGKHTNAIPGKVLRRGKT